MSSKKSPNGLAETVAVLIRSWREERGLSQQHLADRSDVSKNAISLYERAESSPSIHQIGKLAKAMNITMLQFFAGPPNLGDLRHNLPDYGVVSYNKGSSAIMVNLPLFEEIPLKGRLNEGGTEGSHSMAKSEVRHDGIVVVRINGGSMYPTLVPGDLVLVDTHVKRPKSNAIVCIRHKGTPMIARFKRKDRKIGIYPDNPRHPPILAARMGDMELLGEVIRLIHRETGLHAPVIPE
jgi:transcriptional regulator with XRE-family HTH domain